MKMVRKGFIVFWSWVLLVLGLAVLVVFGVGRWNISRALDYVAESGRVTDWDALQEVPERPELNAAPLLEAAALRFNAAPEEFQHTLQEYRKRLGERTAEELAREHPDLLRSDTAHDILHLTDQALERPENVLLLEPSHPITFDDVWELRLITRLYGGRAILAALEGDAARCREALLKGARYTGIPVYPPTILGVLVDGIKLGDMVKTYETCLRTGIPRPEVTRQVEELMQNIDFQGRAAPAFDAERIIMTRLITEPREYQEYAYEMTGHGSIVPAPLLSAWSFLHLPFDISGSLRAYVDMADALETLPIDQLKQRAEVIQKQYKTSRLATDMPRLLSGAIFRPEAYRRLAAYAGQVYRGEQPADLPIDPFTGEPMLARTTETGATMIYSVGRNEEDEQGKGDDYTFILPEPYAGARS
jgi:hypothetical protein